MLLYNNPRRFKYLVLANIKHAAPSARLAHSNKDILGVTDGEFCTSCKDV